MKILFVTDGLFPFIIGGMQKHSTLLINELAKRGCSLTVIHPGGKNFSQDALQEVFSEYSKIEFILIPFPQFGKIPGHYIRENMAYSKSAFFFAEGRLNHFDIIYCQGLTGYYFVLNKLKNHPVIINLHGYGEFFKPPTFKLKLQYFMFRPLMKEISLKADYVYSFGGEITDLLAAIGVKHNKVLSQFNGIDTRYIRDKTTLREHGLTKFVYVGRNEQRKGINEIINTVNKLNLNFSEKFEFHFIGEGTADIPVDAKNVFLHDEKSDLREIFSILDKCDCIVLPSYAEGMPMVLIEAMARGLVVIATDVGATRELISDNGILLKSPKDLLPAMEKIMVMSENELDRMKNCSLALVHEKYNLRRMIDSVFEDFKRIAGQ